MTEHAQVGVAEATQGNDEYTPFIGSYDGPPVNGMVSVTYSAWVRVLAELARMVPFVGNATAGAVLREVRARAGELLHRIEVEIMNGVVQPWSSIRLTPDAPVPPLNGNASKVGVFPITASPFQWCHLLAGMAAIAELELDHVVYLVIDEGAAGEKLLAREVRHAITRELLARFSPLFLYSPLSVAEDDGGVAALFRFLNLNGRQPMAVHFIVGCASSANEARAEEVARAVAAAARNRRDGYDNWMHPLSAVFFGKAPASLRHEQSIKTIEVDFPLLPLSPSGFPKALANGKSKEALATLPFTVFRHVRRLWTHTEAKRR